MKPEMIVNGGVDISLKAHAVCAYCTHFDDYRGDPEAMGLEAFAQAADAHFRSIGWEIGFGGRPTRCPDCNDSFR